jgi:hypothetical protein
MSENQGAAEPGAAPPADNPRELPAPPQGPPPETTPPSDRRADRIAGVDGGAGEGRADKPEVAAQAEEKLNRGSEQADAQARRLRADVPQGFQATFQFGKRARVRDFAGRDMHVTYNYYGDEIRLSAGSVSVDQLTRAERVHVVARSDAELRARCAGDRVVFLRGRQESGRRSSAVRVLDELTGSWRDQSRVTILEAASGISGLSRRLAEGQGYLLDGSAQDWLAGISEAQLAEIQDALGKGRGAFLIVLVDAGTALTVPGVVVEQELPDPGEVVRSHIAVSLAGSRPATPEDRDAAEALLRDGLRIPDAREWYDEITGDAAEDARAAPAEAAYLAAAIAEWGQQRAADAAVRPRIEAFRSQRLTQQARVLLGHGDRSDSPVRQAYVISTAVLDRMAVSEVADEARKLAVRLEKVEGGSARRRIFAETLMHWLSHVDVPASVTEADRPGSSGSTAVVRMPTRRLARRIVEVAWLDYDLVRDPIRDWLVELCGHRDYLIRIRAAQALAFIAAYDYQHVKDKVLGPWSQSDRPIDHQAAGWLLEAMATGAAAGSRMADRVQDLLRRWARSGNWRMRAIAVRAYATQLGAQAPDDAMAGIRISATDPRFRALPDLALGELYADGLHDKVMQELELWTHAYPAMRSRVGRALVRISWIHGSDAGPGSYDLLWRMTYHRQAAGIDLETLAELWNLACQQENSSGAAWEMLGLWARTCRSDSAQRDTFLRLIEILEKKVDDAGRSRFDVYRRRWNHYLAQESEA